jgi:hypothetical protein
VEETQEKRAAHQQQTRQKPFTRKKKKKKHALETTKAKHQKKKKKKNKHEPLVEELEWLQLAELQEDHELFWRQWESRPQPHQMSTRTAQTRPAEGDADEAFQALLLPPSAPVKKGARNDVAPAVPRTTAAPCLAADREKEKSELLESRPKPDYERSSRCGLRPNQWPRTNQGGLPTQSNEWQGARPSCQKNNKIFFCFLSSPSKDTFEAQT